APPVLPQILQNLTLNPDHATAAAATAATNHSTAAPASSPNTVAADRLVVVEHPSPPRPHPPRTQRLLPPEECRRPPSIPTTTATSSTGFLPRAGLLLLKLSPSSKASSSTSILTRALSWAASWFPHPSSGPSCTAPLPRSSTSSTSSPRCSAASLLTESTWLCASCLSSPPSSVDYSIQAHKLMPL
uniref:Uncharacterized protein n=1 Tax=Triticum urartu TaxID=4572 RepID=A0A8R7TVA8_TRIUA